MKKIFSILAAVLFAGSMMAQTTYTFTALETPAEAVAAGLTFTFAKNSGSTNPAWNAANSEARLYAKGSLTITSSSKMITNVVYDYVVNKNNKGKVPTIDGVAGATNAGTWTEETKTWENAIGDTEITLSTSGDAGNLGFKSITITFAGGGDVPSVATPVISGDAEFTESTQVTITCATEGAAIYYTLDSSDPKLEGANVYTAPFNLLETTTVKAVAKVGSDFSVVTTKTFTKFEPLPDTLSCAQAREAALNGMTDEVTIRGYVTEIVEAWSSYKNVSFWMADTQDGGKVFEAYRVKCETAAEAPGVGDLVWVKGQLTKYVKNNDTIPETKQGGTFGIIEKSQIVPQNLGEKTIAEFLALKNTIDTCVLTGVVDSIINTTYGNLYLSDATGQVYVYGVLTADGQSKKFAELGVEAGDELTILALYNEYQGTPQVKNAIFVSVTKKDPTAISNTAVEGKAVKALVNGQVLIIKNGKTYNVLGARVR